MLIELPVGWIVALNATLWPLIQVALAWGFLRIPESRLKPPGSGLGFESAEFYEKWFGIKHWKDRLPDGARWLGSGFIKSELRTRDPEYLNRFLIETWRGELCHGCALLFVPLFFLWNPWWGNLVIIGYAIGANVPCLLAQRYNRLRLRRVLARTSRRL